MTLLSKLSHVWAQSPPDSPHDDPTAPASVTFESIGEAVQMDMISYMFANFLSPSAISLALGVASHLATQAGRPGIAKVLSDPSLPQEIVTIASDAIALASKVSPWVAKASVANAPAEAPAQ